MEEIANEFDMTVETAERMRNKYVHLIEEMSRDIEHWRREGSPMWSTDREKRIAAYQADVERIERELAILGWERGRQAEKTKLLHVIADEMGQLPSRGGMAAEPGKTMAYEFNGIDIGDLT